MRGSAVQREDRPQVGLELPGDRLRGEDLYRGAETSEPGEELRAGHHLHGDGEACRGGGEDPIPAKAVKDNIGHIRGKLQGDLLRLAAVHAKDLAGVFRGVKVGEELFSQAFLAGLGDGFHLIHPVVAAFPVLGIVADEVVIFVIPQECPGTDLVALTFVPVFLFTGDVPIEIAEGDAAAGGDGAVASWIRSTL